MLLTACCRKWRVLLLVALALAAWPAADARPIQAEGFRKGTRAVIERIPKLFGNPTTAPSRTSSHPVETTRGPMTQRPQVELHMPTMNSDGSMKFAGLDSSPKAVTDAAKTRRPQVELRMPTMNSDGSMKFAGLDSSPKVVSDAAITRRPQGELHMPTMNSDGSMMLA
ncbi:hypothetical protein CAUPRSCDRAFT_12355 [Caulochytrium protostelioides]|uniref:Uncharacterized protein n=1 Tax=Caulochytrium protostelioides TaxID=1555241 RepID=A0A4P9WS30_9FUNG|nr:hypothetical protein CAUPRSCDRAFT_12355 [Caulochytrium protostelioides]